MKISFSILQMDLTDFAKKNSQFEISFRFAWVCSLSYIWGVYMNVFFVCFFNWAISKIINWLLGCIWTWLLLLLFITSFPSSYFLWVSAPVLVFQRFSIEGISTAIQNGFRQTFRSMGGEKQVPVAFCFFSTLSFAFWISSLPSIVEILSFNVTIIYSPVSFKLFHSTSLQSFLMRRKTCLHQSKIFRF